MLRWKNGAKVANLHEIKKRNPDNADIDILIDKVIELENECHRQSYHIIDLNNHILELKREKIRLEYAMMIQHLHEPITVKKEVDN